MELEKELRAILPESKIRDRLIDRVSFASDAGFYQLNPKAIVQPNSEEEIARLFQFCRQHRIPLVFRGGGTSLSGQAITDGILVDLSPNWNQIQIEENGKMVRVQPGLTGAYVNARLRPFKRKIGPDPSSISAALMGGILSNNSSGMCCGVKHNSYHTTRSIRFVLPDGSTFDTSVPQDYGRFLNEKSSLASSLQSIQKAIQTSDSLKEKIRSRYKMKNTVGYSMNAFLDFEHPLDVLAHLLIGAEGTLAFIAEARLETIPDSPFKATGLLYFEEVQKVCLAIPELIRLDAAMVELMDRASLKAIENMEGLPPVLKQLPENAAALLIEFQEEEEEKLIQKLRLATEGELQTLVLEKPEFSRNPIVQELYWKVRKGLFPAVGAVRKSGTTVILEDVAFPLENLGAGISGLQEKFRQFGYENAILFGHAKDGNLHFVVTQSFDHPAEITRYDHFLREVVHLVLSLGGTLKAEHGTGRNMAPFVETEWGPEIYRFMQELKQAVDPDGILNPGVILNSDPQVHIQNLKPLPSVEKEVDTCIECGYCEPRCPSRHVTASPRRRIVIRRAMENARKQGKEAEWEELNQASQLESLDTCAVDGLCAGACPVEINTGELVKRLRSESHSQLENQLADWSAYQFKSLEKTGKWAIQIGNGLNRLAGFNALGTLSHQFRKVYHRIPDLSFKIPQAPELPKAKSSQHDEVVYFPACISRLLGTYEGKDKNLMETFLSVAEKCGVKVRMPDGLTGQCCSQIFSSKGFDKAAARQANSTVSFLWELSEEGRLPIVTDVTSCAFTFTQLSGKLNLENEKRFGKLKFMDPIHFLTEFILPRAQAVKRKEEIVLHPVCSLEKMKSMGLLSQIAHHFAEKVHIPIQSGCCGMAGDRGFTHPELTESATRGMAEEVKTLGCSEAYSSTRTCELAMSHATGIHYQSILYLADECL